MKKLLEVYIIILNMSTVNENHTIQSETQCAPDRLFLSSWAIFCPFTPITALKMKISKKKKKKSWRYHHLTQVYQKS